MLNSVQSALLLGLMAAIAWIAVTAIVGPETGLLTALAMVCLLYTSDAADE